MATASDASDKIQDLHVIFPPQWTPYQPFLSTPSLKAYLERYGFAVLQSDWNVEFYHYFIDTPRLALARNRLEKYITTLSLKYERYRARSLYALAVLEDYSIQRDLVSRLHEERTLDSIDLMHRSVKAFCRLLDAFSVAEPVVEVGSSSFTAQRVLEDEQSLDRFTQNRQDNPFVDFFEERILSLSRPRYFGLSIIGTEQIVPGLTLGRLLKLRFPDIPVIIGGSVFSRLVDRTDVIVSFFGKCFDYVCRCEGELPMRAFLSSSNPKTGKVPNIVFIDQGKLTKMELGPQVQMDEVPTPDFSQLPLKRYFSPRLVLPLLSTRGCYWDKCAFCYHGMVYQSRYRIRKPDLIAQDVASLNDRWGARHFAFNDEAIPPLLFRRMPDVIPPGRYAFTGLYKFEKVFTREDFARMYSIGFRSFYVGLESASERVQRHMRKGSLQSTMVSNLRNAHAAGIWNHTFAFFGFPTETDKEAQETIDFLIKNSDIIHSEGTGKFSFEHNAPIHKEPDTFGIKVVIPKSGNIFELYYDYETVSGLDANGAEAMLDRFNVQKTASAAYQSGRWIPREHLLLLVDAFGRDSLKQELNQLDEVVGGNVTVGASLKWFSFPFGEGRRMNFIVSLPKGKVYETNGDAIKVLDLLTPETLVDALVRRFPKLKDIATA